MSILPVAAGYNLPPVHPGPSAVASVSAAATAALLAAASPPSAGPLVGATPPAYNFAENLRGAFDVRAANGSGARVWFAEIQEKLETCNLSGDSLAPAQCFFGIANTYPEGSTERTRYADLALDKLNIVSDSTQLWEGLDEKEKSLKYLYLSYAYKELRPFLPHQSTIINLKIEECSKFVIPLHNSLEKKLDGARLARKKNFVQAEVAYREALELLKGKETDSDYKIAKAYCLLDLFDISRDEAAIYIDAGLTIYALYDDREALIGEPKSTREKVMRTLFQLLTRLQKLNPVNQPKILKEIQEKIDVCEPFLPVRERVIYLKSKKVTKGPVPESRKGPAGGSINYIRLFAVLAFAAVAMGAFALYRITRAD